MKKQEICEQLLHERMLPEFHHRNNKTKKQAKIASWENRMKRSTENISDYKKATNEEDKLTI